MKVLFLYLNAFTSTGGIETFNRAFLKAASEISVERGFEFRAHSLHDQSTDDKYVSRKIVKLYGGNRLTFVPGSIVKGAFSDTVILGHINLAPIGLAIKKLNKSVRVILIAHGIDVWYEQNSVKKSLLRNCDAILSVSEFTKNKLIETHGVKKEKITVFPDTLDPFFVIPNKFEKPRTLLEKHGIIESDKVLLAVCRLSSQEQYKGYDKVIEALPSLLAHYPGIKYLIVGSGDLEEITRVKELAQTLGVENNVILTGFVRNEELTDYYGLADVFVLPSIGEGFGIVFLEALVCGKPVIVGNKDASSEVILDGEIGQSVDPDNGGIIQETIECTLSGKVSKNFLNPGFLQKKAIENFGFDIFKDRLRSYLISTGS